MFFSPDVHKCRAKSRWTYHICIVPPDSFPSVISCHNNGLLVLTLDYLTQLIQTVHVFTSIIFYGFSDNPSKTNCSNVLQQTIDTELFYTLDIRSPSPRLINIDQNGRFWRTLSYGYQRLHQWWKSGMPNQRQSQPIWCVCARSSTSGRHSTQCNAFIINLYLVKTVSGLKNASLPIVRRQHLLIYISPSIQYSWWLGSHKDSEWMQERGANGKNKMDEYTGLGVVVGS